MAKKDDEAWYILPSWANKLLAAVVIVAGGYAVYRYGQYKGTYKTLEAAGLSGSNVVQFNAKDLKKAA